MKGLITLDVDGTITPDFHIIPEEVIACLDALSKQGWAISLLTGRSFHFASHAIKSLPFTFHIAVLNGAMILEMPSRKILERHYLSDSILSKIDHITEKEPTDFVIFAGHERGDVCYYRPQRFSPQMRNYVEQRAKVFDEDWQQVNDFYSLGLKEFASIKCLGPYDVISRIVKQSIDELKITMPMIRDPNNEAYYVGLGTATHVDKGHAVNDLKRILGIKHPVIAAGDDYNDIPMLQQADIKIVMESAPKNILKMADIAAKPATQNGIISALQKAAALF